MTKKERDAHGRPADEVIAASAMVAALALQPADTTATSIRGDVVTDGPFVDAKEVTSTRPAAFVATLRMPGWSSSIRTPSSTIRRANRLSSIRAAPRAMYSRVPCGIPGRSSSLW
ncbi:MAG: hypothetical protein M3Z00_09365 [Actinomycetota bacterium]|nr:hypothetical protein [Actinomycetota bacterium]